MIVIGSKALQIGFEKLGWTLGRVPEDLDLLATSSEMVDFITNFKTLGDYKSLSKYKYSVTTLHGNHIEFEILEESESGGLYSEYLSKMRTAKTVSLYGVSMDVAPLEVLYSIKKSHRHYPRQWEKHIQDFLRLHTHFGGRDVLDRITKIREKETAQREGSKTPSLNKTAKIFQRQRFEPDVRSR